MIKITFQARHKRVFGMILAAFTAFNDIADFMGRANDVMGWFDSINRFMGSQSEEQRRKTKSSPKPLTNWNSK